MANSNELVPAAFYFNVTTPLCTNAHPLSTEDRRLTRDSAVARIHATGLELVRLAESPDTSPIGDHIGQLFRGRLLEPNRHSLRAGIDLSRRISAMLRDLTAAPRAFFLADPSLSVADLDALIRWRCQHRQLGSYILHIPKSTGFTDQHVGQLEAFAEINPPQAPMTPTLDDEILLRTDII